MLSPPAVVHYTYGRRPNDTVRNEIISSSISRISCSGRLTAPCRLTLSPGCGLPAGSNAARDKTETKCKLAAAVDDRRRTARTELDSVEQLDDSICSRDECVSARFGDCDETKQT